MVVAVGTGLRLGEVFGLRWEDVDLDEGKLLVAQALSIDGTFGTPKTPASADSVYFHRAVEQALRSQQLKQKKARLALGSSWSDFGLVFDRGDGNPVNTQWVSRKFSAISRGNGFRITFHGLRHPHATYMVSSGADPQTVSENMRHSSLAITSSLYLQPDEAIHREALAKFERFIGL